MLRPSPASLRDGISSFARHAAAPALLALAAVPPLLILLDIHRYSVNLPYGDEWSWVELIFKFRNGELTLYEVFKWSGEFRPALPRAVVLLLYRLAGRWDVTLELYFNALCAGVGALAWWRILRDGLPQPPSRALSALGLAGISALVFSTAHSLDWVMGYQMVWLLAFAMFSLTVWALVSLRRQRPGLAIAIVAATGGSFCIASGLLAWPLGLLIVWLQSNAGRRPSRHVPVWLIASLACVALYATDYRPNPAATRPEESLGQPLQMAHFTLNYLGAPLGVGLGAMAAALFGATGLAALAALLAAHMAGRDAPATDVLRRLERGALPWLVLAAYAVIQGGLIAFGRLRFGVDYPLIASHYILFGSMLWMALIGLGVTAAARWADRPRTWGTPKRALVVLALGAVLIPAAIGYVTAYRKGRADFQGFNSRLAIAQAYVLYDVASVPDRVIRAIHWDSAVGRQRLMMLYEMREALFATQRVQAATFAQLKAERDRDAALAVLAHAGYARRPIPPSAIRSDACRATNAAAGALSCSPAAGASITATVDLPVATGAQPAYVLIGTSAASLSVVWTLQGATDALPAGEPFTPVRNPAGRDAFVVQMPVSATQAVLTLGYAPASPPGGDSVTLEVFQPGNGGDAR